MLDIFSDCFHLKDKQKHQHNNASWKILHTSILSPPAIRHWLIDKVRHPADVILIYLFIKTMFSVSAFLSTMSDSRTTTLSLQELQLVVSQFNCNSELSHYNYRPCHWCNVDWFWLCLAIFRERKKSNKWLPSWTATIILTIPDVPY